MTARDFPERIGHMKARDRRSHPKSHSFAWCGQRGRWDLLEGSTLFIEFGRESYVELIECVILAPSAVQASVWRDLLESDTYVNHFALGDRAALRARHRAGLIHCGL
jgi:hypothetical protein